MGRPRKHQQKLEQIARSEFGYDSLRPGQETAIQGILSGRDTLAVMPTGSGKSAIYQISTRFLGGSAVVVSPLLALQCDQVAAISKQELGAAAVLNSTLTEAERQEVLTQWERGNLEFLFLAPEQLNQSEILERLETAKPTLFVVDEAHCISEWGHSFRPDYLRLGSTIASLGHPRILALTATAAPLVREEIVLRLGMRDPCVVVQGFDRPNIWLGVERFEEKAEKLEALFSQVSRTEKPGIIYGATRKYTEEIAEYLSERGIPSRFYHAGMKTSDRQEVQAAFMGDEIEVLVATTAFGMGVDKPNVRFVFHYNISDSLDSYYQEIGRAGRDGELAKALLFYDSEDLKIRRFLASKGQLDAEVVERVAEFVQNEEQPIAPTELQEKTDLSKSKLTKALTHLAELGAVETLPTGEVTASEEGVDLSEVTTEVLQAQERRQQYERSRLEMMRGYAEVRGCRREYLLNYFGEILEEPCGFCDNCKAGITIEKNDSLQLFPLNSRVVHTTWGEGLVMRYESDKVVVLFDRVGYKTIGIEIARLRGLLRPATSTRVDADAR